MKMGYRSLLLTVLCGLAFQPMLSLTNDADLSTAIATSNPTGQPAISSSQLPQNSSSIFSKIGQVLASAKKGLGNLFSTRNQEIMVVVFSVLESMENMWGGPVSLLNAEKPSLSSYPTLDALSKDEKFKDIVSAVKIAPSFGMNACVLAGGATIYVGKELLEQASESELRQVLAHERTHYTQNHFYKTLAFSFSFPYLVQLLNSGINQGLYNLKNKYDSAEKGILGKSIACYLNANRWCASNPLLTFIGGKLVRAGFSRYCEKEADMLGALTTGSIEGGISFFEKMHNRPARAAKSFKWLNPFYIIKRINHLPWFSSHPSCDERIARLKELAQAQPQVA